MQVVPSRHLLQLCRPVMPLQLYTRLLQLKGRLNRVQGMPRQHLRQQVKGSYFLHPLPQVHSGS
jgi:hypothetical protein